MKLIEVVRNTYEIDDDVLSEYLDYCDKEEIEPDFDDFVRWIDEQYYFSDFLEEDDSEFESLNNSFQMNMMFKKEIDRLLNEKKND